MRRVVLVGAMVVSLLLGSASMALAHPPDEKGTPAVVNAFNSEPLLRSENSFASRLVASDGNLAAHPGIGGIFQGFVTHAPTCAGHPGISH